MRSLHRQHVDQFLASAIPTTPGLRGLHIGSGGDGRGRYRPSAAQRWINADIVAGHVRADIVALPFRARSFDIVRATEMIYHVGVGGIRGAISECRRVLRPGGRLVITAPLLFSPINGEDRMRLTATGWRDVLPFQDVEITPLGGYYSALVKLLEDRSPAFALLRPLARLDDGSYPVAYGVVAR